ncbi:hypothetical protein TL16_g10841 [Triparma laevis f. inornata]|uniref:Uncharacterized protein n=2 Tax=Triparma laevis TaxID=1534972 RepID=A0A9W7C8A9_9STRA|nr:hypothetical protein TL16_g10841 [Triparma laevis f. inornata]GMI04023.1 hypothetical protein TrLO_g270 [Triparma laevis f. longispina]
MSFTSILACIALIIFIGWIVIFAARMFANAIAQENLRADETWEAEFKAKKMAEQNAADIAAAAASNKV